MRGPRHQLVLLVAMLLALLLVGTSACSSGSDGPTLEPQIGPPLIGEAGVLRVGVDLDYPPFAGTDQGVEAGIDVDVAGAVAERLGLELELVDVGPTGAASALTSGTVDIALAATPITDAVLANMSSAGSYLIDGPAIYSVVASGSVVPTMSAETLAGKRVAVQKESAAYWTLESDFGEGYATAFPTVREALDALVTGQADVVIGDAAVIAYIARDYDNVKFAGQFGSAQPLGIMVKKDATELETKVRAVLDALASDGVLATIRNKWLGELPELTVATQ